MPRVIAPEKRLLLEDRHWLIEKHVNQCFSIRELADQIGVTPSSVSKALRKFGIKSPSQQSLRKASVQRKYGVENVGQIDSVRQQALNTMIDRYAGHNWSTKNRAKRDATCLERYGNPNVGKTEYAIEKSRQTNLERYGRTHHSQVHIPESVIRLLQNPDWLHDQHVVQQKSLTQIAAELGFGDDMTTVMRWLHAHGIDTQLFQRSYGERQLSEFAATLTDEVITNSRLVIPPKELDIFLPQFNLAIEYCGLYWHSEIFRDNKYHLNKLLECQSQGVRLLTIYEDEWQSNPELIKSKIRSIAGQDRSPAVYARNCEVVMIDKIESDMFLSEHHVQRSGAGSVRYALRHNGVNVAVMVWINAHNNKWILNRFATSARVVGGFSKLLRHFQRNHNWSEIVSFADRRWSEGGVYDTNGFALDRTLPPDYYWVRGNNRYHKFNFRHSAMKTKLEQYDPAASEFTNMTNHGFVRLWNCGLLRYNIHNNS